MAVKVACHWGVFQELCRHEVEARGGSAWEVWGYARLSLAGRETGACRRIRWLQVGVDEGGVPTV